MDAIKAEIGKKYLSPKGTAVTVVSHKDGKAVLKINSTGNEVAVPKSYQLKPYEASKVSNDDKALAKANGHAKEKSGNGKGNVKTLAGLIDPLLFAGGKTVREIAGLIIKEAGELAKDKDMEANVRARMVTYRRKNYTIQKDEAKHIRILDPKK
ncbi:MAG: hypothetical protein JW893_02670 [Candidatus Omnitrophica bacterium]|nr:hypothetical protein [Candidatus Omnitrophota bacterium]